MAIVPVEGRLLEPSVGRTYKGLERRVQARPYAPCKSSPYGHGHQYIFFESKMSREWRYAVVPTIVLAHSPMV